MVGYGAAASPVCTSSTVVRRKPPYIMDNLFFGTPLEQVKLPIS